MTNLNKLKLNCDSNCSKNEKKKATKNLPEFKIPSDKKNSAKYEQMGQFPNVIKCTISVQKLA